MTMTRPTEPRWLEHRLDRIREEAAAWADVKSASGELPPAQEQALRDWLDKGPAHQLEYELALGLLSDPSLSAALRADTANLGGRAGPVGALLDWIEGLRPGLYGSAGGVAALLIVVVLAIPALIPNSGGLPASVLSNEAVSQQAATPRGQRRDIRLDDGSMVVLNGGGEIQLTLDVGLRSVALLSGDAYFDVARDQSRPFIVETEQLRLEVLGTKFSASVLEGRTLVTVEEGLVRISPPGAPERGVSVTSGATVEVKSDGAIRTWAGGASGDRVDWRSGWVDAEIMPIGDLVSIIERTTGQSILVAPHLEDLTISGRFRIADADTALDRITLVHDLEIVRADNVYLIRSASPR